MTFENPQKEIPLAPHLVKDLIPSHITNRADLDQWEQDNINEALAWVEKHRRKDILNELFMRRLHQKMFCNVWRWAGKMRQSEVDLGVPSTRISMELKSLSLNVKHWIQTGAFEPDEIAARFHYRLVFIRPFVNGNGRHARLLTDILLENALGRPNFSWGQTQLAPQGLDRKMYIESLVAANQKSYRPLLEFVRS